MTESNPTTLFFHFHFNGSDTGDTRVTRRGGLLHGLRRQRSTNATANARRRNLGTLALALARRSRCETLFLFLRLMGTDQHQLSTPPTADTRLLNQD